MEILRVMLMQAEKVDLPGAKRIEISKLTFL